VIESKQTCGIDVTKATGCEVLSSSQQKPRRMLLLIVLIAFVVRLIAVLIVHSWPMGPDSSLWKTGPEMVNIAQSLASHHGFSSPFGAATGHTAWVPPVYPFLLSLIFSIFGTKTGSSALFILTMQALFSALVCLPVYDIGDLVFGQRIAVSAAWAWALFPYAVLLPVLFIWETALSALLLTMLCCWSMQLGFLPLAWRVGVGLLWGVAALTNTALLVLLPVFMVACVLAPSQWSRCLRVWALVLLACLLTVSPWLWRNWHVLHALVPIRSNFAENLWLGNHPGGTGRVAYGLNASENKQELQKYASMGEIQYLVGRQRQATQFISAHPAEFARLTFYRVQYWWYAKGESARIFTLYILMSALSFCAIVLAFIKRNSGARLVAICILLYPVVYYVTDVYARYRYPIEPLMTLLVTFFVLEVFDWWRSLNGQKRPGRALPPASAAEDP
jgi:4-amino-4-deoxy-L-arabinose transferase-like glycosyltransferase